MKTSKVKAIQEIKGDGVKWNGTYFHNVELENGDKINIGKKKPLQIGNELTYKITGDLGQHEYTKAQSVTPERNNTFNGSKDYQKGVEVGHAINNAVNMICAGVELSCESGNSNEEKIYNYAKTVLAIAKRLKDE